eukprot:1921329-Prorocentrum_lima.AAC.1
MTSVKRREDNLEKFKKRQEDIEAEFADIKEQVSMPEDALEVKKQLLEKLQKDMLNKKEEEQDGDTVIIDGGGPEEAEGLNKNQAKTTNQTKRITVVEDKMDALGGQ